jgi:hypothetical protein
MEPASPLKPATDPAPANFFVQHAVGLGTLVLGAVAFVVTTLTQDALWTLPDWRLTVPFFVATLVGMIVSFARKEGMPILPLAGLGLAGVTVVLGWFFVMAAIIVVTAIIILVMSAVM